MCLEEIYAILCCSVYAESLQVLRLPFLLLFVEDVQHLVVSVNGVVLFTESGLDHIAFACKARVLRQIRYAWCHTSRASLQVHVFAGVQHERVRAGTTEHNDLEGVLTQWNRHVGLRACEVRVLHKEPGPLDRGQLVDVALYGARVHVANDEALVDERLPILTRHQVHVPLLDHNGVCVDAEERDGREVVPLSSLRVEDFAALRPVVLARLASEYQDVPVEHSRERRVEPRHLHLRLLSEVEVGVDREAVLHRRRSLLALLVSDHTTDDPDAPVRRLRRRRSRRDLPL